MNKSDTPGTPAPARQHNVRVGIAWMVVTTLMFAAVTAIVRYVGTEVPATEAAFIRYLFGVILLLPFFPSLFRRPPSMAMIRLNLARGLVHGIAVILWFYAMARIPMAEVTALGYTAPLFVAIGAALFLGDKLHARRIVAILVALCGALVILRPGFQEISIGQLAQLTAAPLFAASFLIAKRLTGSMNSSQIVLMLTICCTLALLPGALMHWQTPSLIETLWLAVTALVATTGHYTMTRALQAAPITVTQPVSFLQLIWASLAGILLFGEAVDPFVLTGGGIVIAAVTFLAHRESVLERQNRTPPDLLTRS